MNIDLNEFLDGPLWQVVNTLTRIKYDVQCDCGQYRSVPPEIAAQAYEWVQQIYDMSESEFAEWKSEE
jgi:hypothetical protein